ncbi:hypothetical protein [Mycoplasmopsis gallinacea]|uniref:Replicative helicase loading/DNA remodeling protein DnaB N-terminal winged helix domain-containing protein n=1 Tax=Mycoplasmopsis gallinacea TaxID=29556 RepID=A0A6H0V5P5_9BACT|nr:hypothetical protein [Mycoplasmopsis gallinacea]QIW62293.1 hypothetical protein GOQ20_02535 [Mycoplasmopsis gallinacea]
MSNNSLRYKYFRLSVNGRIEASDFRNLRTLYAPILKNESILLYEYLNDYLDGAVSKNSEIDFETFIIYLNMSREKINEARKELEAYGLLNTYYDDQASLTVFVLQPPLNGHSIEKNAFVKKFLIERIGETNYKHLINKLNKQNNLNLNELQDVSSSIFEIVDIKKLEISHPSPRLFDSKPVYESPSVSYTLTTEKFMTLGAAKNNDGEIKRFVKEVNTPMKLEIGNTHYSNEYEALLKLSCQDFAQQLLNRNLTSSENITIDIWKSHFGDVKIVNLFIYFAIKSHPNAKLTWTKYARAYYDEVKSTKLSSFEEIENYLDGKFKTTNSLIEVYKSKEIMKNVYLKEN